MVEHNQWSPKKQEQQERKLGGFLVLESKVTGRNKALFIAVKLVEETFSG